MLKKNSKVTKSIIYVFEDKKLAIKLPICEEVIEKEITKEDFFKESVLKTISSNFSYEILKAKESEITKVKDFLKKEEDYCFVHINAIKAENEIIDIMTTEFFKKENKNYKKLMDRGFNIINIDCFIKDFYKEEKYFKDLKAHNILIKDLEDLDFQFLMNNFEENFNKITFNDRNFTTIKLLREELLTEKIEIFLSLSIDIFNESLVIEKISMGNFKKNYLNCDYSNFDEFGLHLEIKDKKLIISAGDFNGEEVHFEDLKEIEDLKYIMMDYVENLIKVS